MCRNLAQLTHYNILGVHSTLLIKICARISSTSRVDLAIDKSVIDQICLLIYYSYMKQDPIFFEKQSFFSLQCGLYSLNHLMGSKVYTEAQMKSICYELSDELINPHKHIFGGDYDVNVLQIALQKKGYTTTWYDTRKLPFRIEQVQNQTQLMGLLINVHTGSSGILQKIFRVSGRHWIGVRKVKESFFWLDSKTEASKQYQKSELQKELNDLLKKGGNGQQKTIVILVYRKVE